MTSISPTPVSRIRHYLPCLLFAVVLLPLFIALAFLPPTRVGDGAEYYGMFHAWLTTHRPWMSAPSWLAYDVLVQSHGIASMVPTDVLRESFPVLRVGTTADFNHFGFYSMLAWGCHQAAAVVGLQLGAHASFLALHWLLLTMTASIAWYHHRWHGIAAVALLVFGSPVFWFIDKVHTEWMTVCLFLSAIILFNARRYLAAFAFLAVASTQNPSFAIIACIPLFCRIAFQREQRFTWAEGAVFLTFSALILAHPLYYFSRYGVPTPTVLAGGAAFGNHLRESYVWIVDPDIGLLPNWPLGLLALIVAGCLWLRQRKTTPTPTDIPWLLLLAGALAIHFYAHSSTTNLNSGATPGLARYALWYLPLLFPLFLWLVRACSFRSRSFYIAAPLVAILVLASLGVNDPRRAERFGDPSLSSRLVQTHLPGLYDPPFEIFMERYSGLGEHSYARAPRVVVGPDCRKMLVWPGAGHHGALASSKCLFDADALTAWVDSPGFEQESGNASPVSYYVNIGQARADALRMHLATGTYGLQAGGTGRKYLESGWASSEEWGVWSNRSHANLVFPCRGTSGNDAAQPFSALLTLRSSGRQPLAISTRGVVLWQGELIGADRAVRVDVPANACNAGYYKLDLDMPATASAQDPDRRAIGLLSIDVKAG